MTDAPSWLVDPGLKLFGDEHHKQVIDAINKFGGYRAAGRALGQSHTGLMKMMKRLAARAAVQGYSPEHDMTHIVPSPFVAKGLSTYYDKHSKPTQQWVKTRLDDAAYQQAMKEGVAAFIEETVRPLQPAPPMPDRDTDVIPWINIGDGHLGMLAHEAETGANFDLAIAERELCAAISILIDDMVHHDRVVINDLGDFTHYENFEGVTQASGHALDYDSRFPKMIRTYSRVMRFIVEKVLEKANTVDVIVNQGNHSRTNDIWMAELLRVAYGASNRVNVLNNDSVFIGYRMGNTLVMTHHSDKCRPDKLISVMTSDFREDFGETEYHYIDVGHIHHNMRTKEHSEASVESFNTLAAKDRWATDGGYRARQSITVVHRSRTYGEVGRAVLPIRRIRDVIAAAMKAEGRDCYRPVSARAFTPAFE